MSYVFRQQDQSVQQYSGLQKVGKEEEADLRSHGRSRYAIKVCRLYLFMGTHYRATERHLPYGITLLPATRHRRTRPALTPGRQTNTRFTYPRGMEG